MKILSNEARGSLYAVMSGILYGFVGYFGIRIIHNGFSISNMLFWRFAIASLLITGMLIFARTKVRLNDPNLWKALISGIIFYSTGSALYFVACRYIGTGLSMVIFFIYPVFVTFIAWLFDRHKISNLHYISIACIVIGMMCLLKPGEIQIELHGILTAILSAVFYAAYIVISKKQSTQLPPLLSTLMICYSGTLMFFIISAFEGKVLMPANFEIWQHVLGISLVSTVLPILFLLKSMKYISAAKASILSGLEPIVVLIIGVSVLGEEISSLQLVGATIVLFGAFLINFDRELIKKR